MIAENDFFDLGGHSLLVSMMVSELRKSFPSIAARDVYDNPTLRGLAAKIQESSGDTDANGRRYMDVDREVHPNAHAKPIT